MRKGEMTRSAILENAMSLASRYGLEGVTIGMLAEELQLSKSGLFAHFKSKEALQIQLLEFVAGRFIERVVKPAFAEPRGIPRIEALVEKWLRWARWDAQPGGCIFVAASVELDDRPGPVRDRLAELQREWIAALARAASIAIEDGDFHKDVDAEQFAYELYGMMLAYHHARRLLDDPRADEKVRNGFSSLIERSRETRRTSARKLRARPQ